MVAPRSAGVTASEQHLAKLANRTFLSLWSYPNVYRDVRISGGRVVGKEVCDLLVICGNDVLIFSDKAIEWPSIDNLDVAWGRWYREAVKQSAKQAKGAHRWITNYPDRLFVDAQCSTKLPISLPPRDTRRVHSIVVASGAAEACRRLRKGGSGSLAIKPALKGDSHITTDSPEYEPFTIGDADPDGPFLHVFDEVSLDILLGELDTVSDFTVYLEQKAALIRSGKLRWAAGEEELLAWYLTSLDENEERAFVKPDGTAWLPLDHVIAEEGAYAKLTAHPQYIARKKADEISYSWDRLIEIFTKHIAEGTIETPRGPSDSEALPTTSEMEIGVRYMALEPRLSRRIHAKGLWDAINRITEPGLRFFRGLRPLAQQAGRTAFGFLLAAPKNYPLAPGPDYLDYRQQRAAMLAAYGMNFLEQNRDLERFVGIAMEPPLVSRGRGGSEDLVLVEPGEWTPETVTFAKEGKATFGIFERAGPMYHVHDTDFPDMPQRAPEPQAPTWMNRAQRRKWQSERRQGKV